MDSKKCELKITILQLLHICLEGDTHDSYFANALYRNLQSAYIFMQMSECMSTLIRHSTLTLDPANPEKQELFHQVGPDAMFNLTLILTLRPPDPG